VKIAITTLLLALILPTPAIAAPSVGVPIVYHSPSGTGTRPSGPNPPVIATEDDQPLYLYIDFDNNPDGGASSGGGTMCEDEDGDETCGFDVLLELTTDSATFDTFTPASANIVGRIDPDTRTTFRVNGVDINGMTIPASIGTLTVDALDANQLDIKVQGVHRVGAAGQMDPIDANVVIVNLPEPDVGLLLISGVAGLSAINRLRQRRAAAA